MKLRFGNKNSYPYRSALVKVVGRTKDLKVVPSLIASKSYRMNVIYLQKVIGFTTGILAFVVGRN